MDGTDFKDFKKEILRKPSVRREYEALKPKYKKSLKKIKKQRRCTPLKKFG